MRNIEMSQRSFTKWIVPVALAALPACTLQKEDGSDEYREAVPLREAMVVAGPESGAGDTSAASTGDTRGTLALPGGARADYAKWYGFTRGVTAGVNVVTGAVLGSVWLIVHTEPSSIEDGTATWGPYSEALDPATYRFRVTRTAQGVYDYVLEGRPKSSHDDGDYRAVLTGHGYGKRHEMHGEGEFTIDLDTARELDPFQHRDDSGTVRLVHHLPRDITSGGDALPRTLVAEVKPNPAVNPESFSVESTANEDGTGTLHVDAHGDTDDTKLTELEDIVVDSRWRADGAGRADIAIAGGDVPADPGLITAVECWGADFGRSYYSDSVGFEATEGEASACVYEVP
jgi:hypothetical protein